MLYTVVEYITEVIQVIVTIIVDIITLWGLLGNPKTITENITKTIQKILGAATDATTPGSQSSTNTVNFNSNVTIIGKCPPILHVNASGEITNLSMLTVTNGVGSKPLNMGQTVTNAIVVNPFVNSSPGSIMIEAPDGTTTGSSQVTFNAAVPSVDIENDDPSLPLVIQGLDAFGADSPPSIIDMALSGGTNWNFTLNTGESTLGSDITISSPGDITLEGPIDNPGGSVTLSSTGGNILASGPGSYIDAGAINLSTPAGAIGGSQSLPLELPSSEQSLGGVQANGYLGVNLTLTAMASTPGSIVLQRGEHHRGERERQHRHQRCSTSAISRYERGGPW